MEILCEICIWRVDSPEHGEPLLTGIIHDVTERKQVADALRRTTLKLQAFFDAYPDLLFRLRADGTILDYHAGREEDLYTPPQAFLGKRIQDVLPPAVVSQMIPLIAQSIESQSKTRLEYELPLPTGSTPFEVRFIPQGDAEVMAIVRNIADRREAEDSLRESEERFALFMEHLPGLAFMKDNAGRHIFVNAATEDVFGIPCDAFIGKTFREVFPNDPRTVRQIPEEDRWVLDNKQVLETTQTVELKDGNHVLLTKKFPIQRDGRPTLLAGMSIDITERQRTENELKELNATLENRVAERTTELREAVAELDEFAHTVAHDLRSPLRAMHGFAQALLEDYADALDPVGQDYADRISGAADRMERLIRDLLAYSRTNRAEVTLEPVDLMSVVAEVKAEAAFELNERNTTLTVDEAMPKVTGHHRLLVRVVSNLLTNAVKFVPGDRRPEVRIWAESERDGVRVWVKDNGIGIDSQHGERVFHIFERLHGREKYPGTGAGLAIVRRAIERMHGRVGFESEVGRGSRFWFELPNVDSP